jgi:hypothetical protein
MNEFLLKMIGRTVDISCGGASSLRGTIVKIEGGVLHVQDTNDKMCYVAIDKIVVVWETRTEEHRAGFVPSLLNTK